jgi:lipopolysaccharide/colanic/teichoic acid biosynthesis glycosyltransferase
MAVQTHQTAVAAPALSMLSLGMLILSLISILEGNVPVLAAVERRGMKMVHYAT